MKLMETFTKIRKKGIKPKMRTKSMMGIVALLILIIPFASAKNPPRFEDLIGGKIDPSLNLLENASIIVLKQEIIVRGGGGVGEEVIVEYFEDAPISGVTYVEWDEYTTKYRRENLTIGDLATFANSDQIVAIWKEAEAVPTSYPVDCNWGSSNLQPKTLWDAVGIMGVWQRGFKGQGVYVMVVDTGIQQSEEFDVVGELTMEKDYDPNLHGTLSASIIASKHERYPGIAPEAKLYDCPAVGANMPFKLDECFDWAIKKFEREGRPQIISNSWSFINPISPNHIVVRKIKEAVDKGIAVVIAASNCGSGCEKYGSCCDGSGKTVGQGCEDQDKLRGVGVSIHGANQLRDVITVAAVDAQTFYREGYSSQGPSYASGGIYAVEKPDISGFADFQVWTGERLQTFTGTSAATPTIAAGIALMLSANPNLPNKNIRKIIYSTAYLPKFCSDCRYEIGRGIMNYPESVTQATLSFCGNNICESGETTSTCPSDCETICDSVTCDDANDCTIDICEVKNGDPSCVFTTQFPCCGNGQCEFGEGIWGCATDCDLWMCEDNCEYIIATNDIREVPNGMCADECKGFCGDQICELSEDEISCEIDCLTHKQFGITVILVVVVVIILIIASLTYIFVRRLLKK